MQMEGRRFCLTSTGALWCILVTLLTGPPAATKSVCTVAVQVTQFLSSAAERLHPPGGFYPGGVQHVPEQHLPTIRAGPHLL